MPYTSHVLKSTIDLPLQVRVAFKLYPGTPEEGPSYACGGTPGQDPEIETSRVWIVAEDGREHVAPDWLEAIISKHCAEDMESKAQDDEDRSREDADERRWADRLEDA